MAEPVKNHLAGGKQDTHDLSNRTPVSHQVDTVKKSIKSLGKEYLTWKELSEKSRSNISDSSVLKLAEDLAVSPESLYALNIGFAEHAYTFPMRNGDGEIVGIRKRPYRDPHSKRCIGGGNQGLFIPEGVTRANVDMICEGESDTAAAVTLGFAAIGRPGSTACQGEAVRFLSHKLNACTCIVADSNETGTTGAGLQAAALVEAGIPCRLLCVPDPHEDLRDWLKSGLTASDLVKAIEAQEISYPVGYPQGFSMIPHAFARKGLIARIGRSTFSVLMALASFADEDGACWPERERVAELTGLTPRTVDRSKRDLERWGLLRWKRGGTNRPNTYHIDFGPIRGSTTKYSVRPALRPQEKARPSGIAETNAVPPKGIITGPGKQPGEESRKDA